MKYIIMILALVLIGCTKEGTPTEVTSAVDKFEVTLLFKKDNCSVYRFYDGNDGRAHYFTDCTETMTTVSYQCGKARCHRQENIGGK